MKRFYVHMTVRKSDERGWPYTTCIDADNEDDARKKAIEYVRFHYQLETLEIRDVSSAPDTD